MKWTLPVLIFTICSPTLLAGCASDEQSDYNKQLLAEDAAFTKPAQAPRFQFDCPHGDVREAAMLANIAAITAGASQAFFNSHNGSGDWNGQRKYPQEPKNLCQPDTPANQ